MQPTRVQSLVSVRDACATIGHKVHVRPQDEVVNVAVSDDTVTFLIQRIAITETVSRIHYQSAEVELIQFYLADGTWKRRKFGEAQSVKTTDNTFSGYTVVKGGVVRSPAEQREREQFEASCYRPGSGQRLGERDSCDRALLGYTPDFVGPDMWKVGF